MEISKTEIFLLQSFNMPKVSEKHKAKVKNGILNAAIKSFSKTGFAVTTMDDIAKTANVSKGTLYLHFQSKEDLFESIFRLNQQKLIDERDGLFQDKNKIKYDLGLFYDNFISTAKATQKIEIEALAESMHNPKLRKIIQKNRKDVEGDFEEFFKNLRKMGFLKKGYDASISSGVIALFDGLYLNEMLGANHSENKKAWVKTMMTIFEGM